MADENPIIPVLDETIKLMEQALTEKQADTKKIEDLTASLKKAKEEQEKVILEKVAAAKASFFDVDNVLVPVLNKLVGMGVLNQEGATKVANRVIAEPNALPTFLLKVAERLMTAPGEGHGVDQEQPTEANAKDPDGWIDFAQGRDVKVRR